MVGSGSIDAPPAVLVPLILVASALFGALLMLGPTLLKAKLGVDEVVTTLLLNFIVLLFVQMMLEGPLKTPWEEAGLRASPSWMPASSRLSSSVCAFTQVFSWALDYA
jgi:simple sugar transport system permease protein